MPVEPEEDREAASAPSSTGRSGVGPSMEPEEVPEEGAGAPKSPSVKSKSPPDSTSSSSPESDLEILGAQHQGTYKAKDFPLPLSPDRVMSAKRCLWDVDERVVDESLSREQKRIRQEESLVKCGKWNFDFDKEVPLSGPWAWEKAKSPPEFYKIKDCPKKKTQSRFSPYERSASISVPVSSSGISQTSSTSLVTSSRELRTLRSSVTSSTVPSPETSTKECVRSSEDSSSVSSVDIGVTHGSSSSAVSRTTHSTTTTTSPAPVNPDIYSPDYFKPPVPVIQCSRVEDIPKTSSIVSSSTSIASSSNVDNNGSICISSSSISSDNKNNTEPSSKGTGSSSSSSSDTSRKNGSNKNTTPSSSSSSNTAELESSYSSVEDISRAVSCDVSGIIPERFYSNETSEITERGELNVDSSSTSKSSGSTKKKEKSKLKSSKPSSSDSSSSSLLKYYR